MKTPSQADFPEAFNGGFRPAVTKCRCPKCGSRDLHLTETIEANTSFQVVNGRLNREAGVHEFGGCVGKLAGECSRCGHAWNVRGAAQIEDAVNELDPKTFAPL